MIERVIGAFNHWGFNLDDTEIADILWLAVQMRRCDLSPMSELPQETPVVTPEIDPNTKLPRDRQNNSPKSPTKTETNAKVYPQSSQDSNETSSGLPIKVPAAQALRNQLDISRSLRPLKRRVLSKREFSLDEIATAERIAEEKLLLPVMRPAPERWLELALVVDEGESMMLWTQTIKEFKQLLERHGAFRDVRTWGLFSDERGKVWLRPRTDSRSRKKRLHNPRELIDPNGRRLFVIISDCVSPAWRSGAIAKILAVWANTSLTTIIQVLPEWLWERSTLGIAESIVLRSLAPGVPNQQLIMTALDLLDESDVANKLKIPVVTLEPESLKNWARMVVGGGDVQTKGFLLPQNGEIFDVRSQSTDSSSVELTAKQRLQRFRLTASPMARKLAGLLAATPVSLPVVRLIQQTMLQKSSQVHVAEVFLGGILKLLSPVNEDVEADKIQFDFADGVRDLLLDEVPLTESTEVLRQVSEYISQKVGLSVDEFTAMLINPGLVDSSSGVLVRPFAQITAKVLRRLGGKYAELAQEIEQSFQFLSQTAISQVQEESSQLPYEYQVSGSLPSDAPTYVIRQADTDLYENLKNGQFCYVLGPRQIGRSSLLLRVMNRLVNEGFACALIYIPALGIGDITPDQWYAGLIYTLVDSFNLLYTNFYLETWLDDNDILSPVQKFSKFIEDVLLKRITENIVIFMDEIDGILNLQFKDDFFAIIRDCYNHRVDYPAYNRLTFVILGVATPSDLIQDKKRTPFNIGRAIELKNFQLHETEPLAKGLAGVGNSQKPMEAILYWTGGQPFLTQKLCSLAVKSNIVRPANGYEAHWIEDLVRSEIIDDWEKKDEPEHLKTVSNRILSSNVISERLLRVYQEILQRGERKSDFSQEVIYLLLSGLIVQQADKLKLNNRIYKEVFNKVWVNAQLQQFKLKKILFLSGNPTTSRLRLDEEVREIDSVLRSSKQRDRFEITSRWAVRPDDLRWSLLDSEAEIVYFSGHGAGNQGLVLEDNSGGMQVVSPESLTNLFKLFNNKIECVILNGCYSEVQAQAISQDISYVIGINHEMSDQTAIKFVVGFYDALGAGRSYDDAYEFGCNTIDLEDFPEHLKPILIKKAKQLIDDELESNSQDTQDLRQLVYTNPYETVRILEQKLSTSVKQEEIEEVLQLASLVETIAEPLIESGFESFIIYTKVIVAVSNGQYKLINLDNEPLGKILYYLYEELDENTFIDFLTENYHNFEDIELLLSNTYSNEYINFKSFVDLAIQTIKPEFDGKVYVKYNIYYSTHDEGDKIVFPLNQQAVQIHLRQVPEFITKTDGESLGVNLEHGQEIEMVLCILNSGEYELLDSDIEEGTVEISINKPELHEESDEE
ncbi:CHAT domain-containing protein (plasmid) [Nostoc sp. C057]|uniref:SAV_2336 N-terminal domain-related protein n=1 Tax=Nostoc sp. C057 TaxID=2576903 RepID=UPI0015C337F3|nr:SAV_2336 N-terminal domain-related protein [Nostoc sp. C057]QLE53604.1 CHAT domain-containing protein [Nostoc sp. C057]